MAVGLRLIQMNEQKEYKEDADHPETVFFEVPIISA